MLSLARSICLPGLAALTMIGAVTTAQAQPAELAISADSDWDHAWTAMTFPARLGEFEREAITQFEERQSNVSARYLDANSQTILSLFIYRPGNPSASIWFDRALVAIGVPDRTYGAVDLENLKISTFVPSGGNASSGLSAVLAVDGNIRSTAVALYRADEWLVKVRISSRELSVAQMDVLLRNTLPQLAALEGVDANPAQFVEACAGTLQFGPAQPIEAGLGTIAMGQAISVAADALPQDGKPSEGASQDRGSLAYCRQGPRIPQYNVFRSLGTDDRYTVGVGDAGFTVEVYPDLVATELNQNESGAEVYAVQTASGLEVNLHTPFSGMPTFQMAGQSAMNGPTLAKVSRPLSEDEDQQISITSDLD